MLTALTITPPMPTRAPADSDLRLYIDRADLRRTTFGPDPDAARPLAEGQARLEIEQFALTANNITYAAFGEAMQYWRFFPAPDAAWGCLPVWGFAKVVETRAAGVADGRRVWGYYPAGTHLIVTPGRVRPVGFVDASAHRAGLAAAYQQYVFCDADPGWQPRLEGLQAVLKPLFVTSFLIDDFLADNGHLGARQLLLSSASSKTAYATAFCLGLRSGAPDAPRRVGLTSAARLPFVRSLGCYDAVCAYDDLAALDPAVPTVYIDFAGDAALRRAVHEHFLDALKFSSSVGGTHVTALGPGRGLPGPRPTLFFAPERILMRSAPPPEGWGREALEQRIAQAWSAFISRAEKADDPWIEIVHRRGAQALEAAYRAQLEGTADPRAGCMVGLKAQASQPPGR